jgi:chitinase
VGEEAALAGGFTALARTIFIAGEVGNAAFTIYDTVENPDNAVFNILGMLLGVGAIAKVERTGKGLGDVARIRHGLDSADIANLGSIFKDNDDKLQSFLRVCRR